MMHLEKYKVKRRIIRKALKIHDELNDVQNKIDALENEKKNLHNKLIVIKNKMTGGDRGKYDMIMLSGMEVDDA